MALPGQKETVMPLTPASRSHTDRRLLRTRAIAATRAVTRVQGGIGKARTLIARFGRLLVVMGAGLALALSVSGTSAEAVTTMHVGLNIETYPGVSLDNNKYALNIDVLLPSNRWDGQGYINNGAVITLKVMGADTWSDDLQMGPYTYSVSNGLFADDDGIHLRLHLPATYDQLNEDWGTIDTAGDEIYIQATWIDGDGATINSRSNEVSGIF
jgi:hypothetical protein